MATCEGKWPENLWLNYELLNGVTIIFYVPMHGYHLKSLLYKGVCASKANLPSNEIVTIFFSGGYVSHANFKYKYKCNVFNACLQ